MNEFRRLAAKIDQHMQRLAAEGVNYAPTTTNRMMGYVPDLHKIWVGTTDDQLVALSDEFSGFYRYALLIEEASEAERNKPSRPYDGMSQLPERNRLDPSHFYQATSAADANEGAGFPLRRSAMIFAK